MFSLELWLPHLKVMGIITTLMLAIMGMYLLGSLLFSRKRRVRAFISFKHSHEEIVNEIKLNMNDKHLSVTNLPFDEEAGHDQVLQQVRVGLKKSEALIVVPGAQTSFVDAEIFASSQAEKPILFIKHQEDQMIPDTAFQGYPVLNLEKVREWGLLR